MRFTRFQLLFVPLLAAAVGCGGGGGDGSPNETGTVSGVVRRSGSDTPVAGVTVAVGSASTSSAADGRYGLSGVPTGQRSIVASAPGYTNYSASVSVAAAGTTHDIALVPATVFRSDSAALYIPAETPAVRAILVYLGDFDSRPVASNTGYPSNFVGDAMRLFRTSVTDLALRHGVAIMGITNQTVAQSDEQAAAKVAAAVAALATASGHPEVATAPLLLYAVFTAAPPTFWFAQQQPERTVGFFTWMTASRFPTMSAAAQQVPGALMLAGLDSLTDNAAVRSWFDANRAAGALWSIGVEPGVLHGAPDAAVTALTVQWLDDVLTQRLPAGATSLVPLQESAGWLGDLTTFDIVAHDQYAGAPLSAAWLPTQASAAQWQSVVK